jgi:hypothetical protein
MTEGIKPWCLAQANKVIAGPNVIVYMLIVSVRIRGCICHLRVLFLSATLVLYQ